ncbi:MAG TPA: pitrilysin family protein [candidate division Zixibacteria bacterium]|nr:pitrilysin family protein [candidate division Zixibacteria bacterium]
MQEFVLDNGLKVLLLEDRKSPAVTFQVWYRVGSRNEKDGKSGLSHFLEHMLFKGTAKVGPEEYSRIIAKNGGRSNAFTTQDVTVYFATMSREKIGVEIELEADRMANASLSAEFFEPEKKVIQEERRLRTEDQPVSALAETTGAVAYLVHPYRRPVVGWMEDIVRLSRQDLVDYYRLYYVPNNAFIVMVGDFEIAEVLPKIKAAFGAIQRGPQPPKVEVVEPPQRGERRVILKRPAELPFILIYYHAPNLKNPDSFALEVLTYILAGGRSSRLYRELVYEKRLARSIDADYSSVSVDPPVLSITAQLMPGRDVAAVEREIDALIDRVKTEGVTERELEKAKNQIEAGFVFAQDSVFGQALKIGYYEAVGDWRLMNNYLDGIRKVSRDDVVRVARQYLDRDRRTVGILVPTSENVQ